METNQSLFDKPSTVKDLKPGEVVILFLELRSTEVRKTRSGHDYLDLVVGDATGSIGAKMWSDAIRKWGSDFSTGDVVKIEGRVEVYRDRNQIVVEKIRKAEASEAPDPSTLRKESPYSADDLSGELTRIAQTLDPPDLAALVTYVLEKYQEGLRTAPAAKMIHHAYQGGLLEHIVTVTRKVEAILKLEPAINRNIAIAGAILHDMGKVVELAPAGKTRTLEGRLIGHVVLGAEVIRKAAWEKGIKDQVWLYELEHIVLSHHGETQFGAPVRPLTREAILVHFIDNLDAKLKIIEEALEETDSEGFTPYNKWLEGRAFTGGGSLPQEE